MLLLFVGKCLLFGKSQNKIIHTRGTEDKQTKLIVTCRYMQNNEIYCITSLGFHSSYKGGGGLAHTTSYLQWTQGVQWLSW